MNSKKLLRRVFVFIIFALLLIACSSGYLFEPTITPTPTPTQTLTATPTNTPTPDPMIKAMQDANQLWLSEDGAGAISQYESILHQSTESSIRIAVFAKLEEIGAETLQQAVLQDTQSGSHEDGIKACETYKLALSAYTPILKSQDRPTFEQDSFYTDAAIVDVALINCHLWYDEPNQSYNEVINSFLENLASYPDKPAVMDILVPAIIKTYQDMAQNMMFGKYNDTQQEVINTGQALINKVGSYEIDGKKATVIVTSALAQVAICSKNPFTIPNVDIGTSTIKKVESCPFFGSNSEIDTAGMRASNPSEIWFILENESVEKDDVKCTGYYIDAGTNFTYLYSGRSDDVYLLKDVHTGKIVAKKTFVGTAPKCVFTSCSLNTFTNTATCTGGEGQSTYDEAVLIQWLKSNVK
jgi:sulfur transfer complex TusBCD TusB component (DsrH family)